MNSINLLNTVLFLLSSVSFPQKNEQKTTVKKERKRK